MNLMVSLMMVVVTRNKITGDQGWTFFFKRLVQLSIVFPFYKIFFLLLVLVQGKHDISIRGCHQAHFGLFPCYFSPTHLKIQLLMFSCWTDSHAVL